MLDRFSRTVTTVSETAAVAQSLLNALSPQPHAIVVALHGDLGAGKTTFVQQLAEAMGVTESVTSPTFVIQKNYPTAAPWEQLVHIDAYRLDSPAELDRLGFTEVCQTPHTIVCIEWAERVDTLLPTDTIHLAFTVHGTERIISHSNYAQEN